MRLLTAILAIMGVILAGHLALIVGRRMLGKRINLSDELRYFLFSELAWLIIAAALIIYLGGRRTRSWLACSAADASRPRWPRRATGNARWTIACAFFAKSTIV